MTDVTRLVHKTLGELYAPYQVKPEGAPVLIWNAETRETWKLVRKADDPRFHTYRLIGENE